jgi:hypothetical protein
MYGKSVGPSPETLYSVRRKALNDKIGALKQRYGEYSSKLDSQTKSELDKSLNSLTTSDMDYWKDLQAGTKGGQIDTDEASFNSLAQTFEKAMSMDDTFYKMRTFLDERQKSLKDKPGQRQVQGGLADKPLNLLTGPTSPINSTGLITGR